jgi:PAS domain S-box-containing protein
MVRHTQDEQQGRSEAPPPRDPRLNIRSLPASKTEPDGKEHDQAREAADFGLKDLDLQSIVDRQHIQAIMDDFHALTGMVTAILDLKGNILQATGWQDLCTQFHRVHPATSQNCTESDLALAATLAPGQYADYHCKNGLRDVVTPLYIRNQHVGNIFTGQFFYEDDEVDFERFAEQARQSGFDVDDYLEALRKIPRYKRETIADLMRFLVRMTEHISQIGLANLELERESRIRQEAETGWQNSRARLRAMLHSIPDLVWLKDPDGIYLLCNRRFEQFFGAKSSDIVGKSDAEFLSPELVEFFRAHDRRAMARGVPTMNIEEVEFAADGHREILETIKTPIYDSEGRCMGVLGIGRDVTSRIEADQALRENEARLREAQRMEPIGRLAAGVSHDLNNLLTPIIGYAELLGDEFRPDDPQHTSVDHIIYAAERAQELVAQLLAFGRRQTLEYQVVDLNQAAHSVEKLLHRSLRANIQLRLDLDPKLPQIRADLGQIEQVIMNLALNAADAMPSGGDLRIETRARDAHQALEEASGPGPYAMLAVHDTGRGMDQETLAHVFEPFFSTKGELGTGLGLSTVHGIVKQHGGEVLVESAPACGSTFVVYVPALREENAGNAEPSSEAIPAESAAAAPSPAQASSAPAQILLVEDNQQVRGITTTLLERHGFDVQQAGSGEEALPLLERAEPAIELLITDIVMPGMSGRELYDRASKLRPELPVLFMSGFADQEISIAGQGQAREAFLPKPFKSHDLLSLVHRLLAQGARH